METLKDIKNIYIKGTHWINRFLIKSGIIKIKGFKQHSLSKEYWVELVFNFWNPLTYLYLIFVLMLEIPICIFDGGLKQMWKIMKRELTTGFGEWVSR